jgi:hypothetical protein
MEGDTQKRYNSVLEIIDKRLIPDEEAKKARGEVFTPLNLVREMLFGLRKSALDKKESEVWGIDKDGNFFDDDENDRIGGIPLDVWRDPKTTWLDPANGIGNFPVVAFYMLDYQIGNHGPSEYRGDKNKDKRRKHIVKNMLFMIELNKGNVNTARKIFKQIVPGVEANIICANTLNMSDEKIKKEFGTDKFNVIMGNPPFNAGGTHQNGSQIWEYFLVGDTREGEKKLYNFSGGINLLDKDGLLLFVNPQGWRTPAYSNVFKKVKLTYIEVLKILDTSKYFSINFPLDYFLIKNTEKKGTTALINEQMGIYKKYKINNLDFIPNYAWDIFEKWKELNIETIEVKSTSTHNFSTKKNLFSNERSLIFKYPIIKTIDKDGPNIGYSSLKHIDQDKIKVLIAFGSYLYPTIDRGEYGVSQNVFYILCNTIGDAQKIKDYMESSYISCLVNSLKISSYAVSNKLLSYLPNPILFKGNIKSGLLLTEEHDTLLDLCNSNAPKKRIAKTEKKSKAKKGGAKSHRYTRRKSRT